MGKDLRQFLEMAKKAGADYYVEVNRPVTVDLEVCVLQQKLAKEGRYPVIYYPQVRGSRLPYCSNLFGSYELLGLAMDIEPDTLEQIGKAEVQQEYIRRDNNPKPVQWVAAAEAPVKDIISKGKDIDLGILPIPKHTELDSGKYIISGFSICKDVDTGIANMGIYRCEVKGKSQLGWTIFPAPHHGGYIARRYAESGQTMAVVLAIGHHPAVSLAAVTGGLLEMNELEVAGGLLGEPLRVTRGETVDLPVPADAEIVIEGVIDPARMVTDGPFPEYAGYYGPKRPSYLLNVTAITRRHDAIYHGLDPAHRELMLYMTLPAESRAYHVVKRRIPTVKAVHAPPSGRSQHYYVSIAKRAEGEGMLAGLLAISAHLDSKLVIVVDEDVDVFDEAEVLWALATRTSWDKDIAVIPQVLHNAIDPRAYGETGDEKAVSKGEMIGKIIIDATRPVTLPYATRITPPKELWDTMKLTDYL